MCNAPPTSDEPVPPSYTQSPATPTSEFIEPLPPVYSPNGSSDSDGDLHFNPEELSRIRGQRKTDRDLEEHQNPPSASSQLFSAIEQGNREWIARLLEEGGVTANTRRNDETPLLWAVKTRDVQIVQQLLDAGAEPDAFGSVGIDHDSPLESRSIIRTPLQLAASMGHLMIVKLLIKTYHCDDSIVAPDGQIALRLAAEHGHLEIVNYLPSRRNGGFKRWQFRNRKALRRIKIICAKIGTFVKFFVFDLEKFFFWTVPKHVFVEPVVKACKWCWARRKEFGPWCRHQAKEMPGRVKRFGAWVGRKLMKIPQGLKEVVKGTWKFATETLPRWIKEFSVWLWKLLTVKLPKALKILRQWLLDGITSLGKTMWDAVLKVVSFFSTVFDAIVTFFRNLTLKDIWNGFVEACRAIFIALPKLLWSWIEAFGETSYKVLKALFGTLGQVLWYLGYSVLWVATYLPKQLWRILESIGGSLAKAGYEIKVWLNPKAR